MRKTVLALVAFAAIAPAVPAAAQPTPPVSVEHAKDCFVQYVTVAEPPMRPVVITSEGQVTVTPSEATNKVVRDANRTARFAACLAEG